MFLGLSTDLRVLKHGVADLTTKAPTPSNSEVTAQTQILQDLSKDTTLAEAALSTTYRWLLQQKIDPHLRNSDVQPHT